MLIIRRSKLHYTASGIITPIGVMIPEASIWLIAEIIILRCMVSKTCKNVSILVESSSGPSKIFILEGPEDDFIRIETCRPNTIINIIKFCCV